MTPETPEENPPRPGGRKRVRRPVVKKRAKEDQLTCQIGVSLSKAELELLIAQTKQYGLKMSPILRAAWLQLPLPSPALPEVLVPAAQPARVLSVAELADYKQLVGMASNLNQLTKQVHLGSNVQEELTTLLAELRQLLAQLMPPHQKRRKDK